MMGSAQTDKGKVMTMAGKLAGSRPLVIVVDDDLAVRSSLQFSLEMEGFAVHTYADGRELLDGSNVAESSCLVIDHHLPGMTGLETLAKLRQRIDDDKPTRLLRAQQPSSSPKESRSRLWKNHCWTIP